MRLELLLNLDAPNLPQDYKPLFVSYLKNALSKCNDGKFYDRYFGSVGVKDYSFSVMLSKPRFIEGNIELGERQVKILFTANDKEKTGLIFWHAFISQKNKRFPLPNGNGITLKKINQLQEKLITSNKVIFKTVTGAGLAIRKHDREKNRDWYFVIQDEEFQNQMKVVLGAQAKKAGFSDEIAKNIDIKPIQCKKVVVKQFGTFVDVTVGIFEMEADCELLQYFYQAGMGSRHSQGLGVVDVIHPN